MHPKTLTTRIEEALEISRTACNRLLQAEAEVKELENLPPVFVTIDGEDETAESYANIEDAEQAAALARAAGSAAIIYIGSGFSGVLVEDADAVRYLFDAM